MVQESRDRGRKNAGLQGERGERTSDSSRGGSSDMLPAERNVGLSPFNLMSQLTQEMDRMFEGFWNRPFGWMRGRTRDGGELARSEGRWMPELEMHEHDGQFLVRLDLPGMQREDVDVEVVGQTLTIQGERKQECQSDENGWHHSECRYGSFFRSIPLPEDVDPERIQAQFENGVLEVRMPAPDRTERRNRIEVREGASAGRADGAKQQGNVGRSEAT